MKVNSVFVWNFYIKRITLVIEVSCGVHWHNRKCFILIKCVAQKPYFIIYHKISITVLLSKTNFTDRLLNIHKILNYIYGSSSNNSVRGILYSIRRLQQLLLQICILGIKPNVSGERDQVQER